MSGKFLPDTSVVVEFLRGNASIMARIADAAQIYAFSTVVGELYFGALISDRPKENAQLVGAFASTASYLPCDLDTAREYGLIKKQLRDKGKPIPENDIWIAAACKQHGLTLVTQDAHFGVIDELDQERW